MIQQRLPGAFSSLTRETVFHLESGPGGGILLIGDYLPFTGDLEKSYRRVFQFCNSFGAFRTSCRSRIRNIVAGGRDHNNVN
ncbi:MAG TPA: hypothetical protein VL285_03565 [Bryobacteraceae bacterium]|nr:hypothetical protein [Bryobacteraceae bacterium]